MTPNDLDDLLNHELKRLPPPRAPRTLLPRVMAAVEQRADAPWYVRGWTSWPGEWKAASLVALPAVALTILLAMWGTQWLAAALWSFADVDAPARTAAVFRVARQAAAVMRVSWDVLLQPVATYVAVLMLATSLMCAALWNALNRFAFEEASHQ